MPEQRNREVKRMSGVVKCSQCGERVDPLAVFPGGLCLKCWKPIGEREAATMTAEKLAAMWGGRARCPICGCPPDGRYVDVVNGHACVDKCHWPYLTPAALEQAKTALEEIRKRSDR